ncbi:hypothetical protein IP76_18940 [Rhizobium sp. AAP43]|nr:hypothetical protein IP76_18940 [Rhizobium sp. AAP43]
MRHLGVYRLPLRSNIVKRVLDITISLIAIIALLPMALLVALLIKASDGGTVFYSHRRVGWRGRDFGCLKFRTMRTDAAAQLAALLKDNPEARAEWEETRKLRNDPRITVVGEVLRKSSLDELPQLLNVLAGHMSIVGPRPVTREELIRYGDHVDLYTAARPGLTGHWQTSGRSNTCFEHRVALDVEYVTRWSLSWDLWIMAKTVPVLFSREGAY